MPPIQDDVVDQTTKSGFDIITVFLDVADFDKGGAIPRRTFELSLDNKKAPIGRSSKTVSKGLVPAATNGYFDSPVVSREHAVIEADIDSGVVHLTDLGSLHGTSINGNRLQANDPHALANGDNIRFGAHVARGLDVYSPTTCKVQIVTHYNEAAPVVERARSYCAPESVYDTSDSESSVAHDSQTDEPSFNSGDGESLMECDSPTLTAANKVVAEKGDNANGPVLPNINSAEIVHVDDTDDDEVSYAHDSGDVSSSEDEGETDEESNDDEDDDDEEMEEGYDDDGDDEKEQTNDEGHLQDWNESLAESLSKVTEDDDAVFLEKEIRHFIDKANEEEKALDKKMRDVVRKVRMASQDPQALDEAPIPEPADAVDTLPVEPAPITASTDEVHDTVMEEVSEANDARSDTQSSVNNATACTPGNKKIDIPSILNPSPPSLLLSGAEKDPSHYVFANELPSAVATSNANPFSSRPTLLTPIETLSYAAEEAAAWQMPALVQQAPVSDVAPTPDAPDAAAVLCAAEQPVHETHEVVVQKTAKKRKIGAVLAEDVELLARSLSSQIASAKAQEPKATPEAMRTPPAEDGPAHKRQATSSSVAAKSQAKSRAWAAVEKIGIAALGGAVVLGSLIYTAPTF